MKYFFDTEFIENGPAHWPIILSIGIVAEDGRELYIERLNPDLMVASEWVMTNVVPHLHLPENEQTPFVKMGDAIREWIGDDKPEFWAYYADYDWVILCGLFGRMIDLPDGWPMYCRDIKQLADSLGNPRLPTQATTEHHALADARWNVEAYRFLMAQGGVA